ncbi:MAG: tetratricopeptide repeat protein [Elusimicrobiota bacterium]
MSRCLAAMLLASACSAAWGHPCPKKKAAAPLSQEDAARRQALRHWNNGIIYYQAKRYEKAAKEWAACFELDPENADCRDGLKRLQYPVPAAKAPRREAPDADRRKALGHWSTGIVLFQQMRYREAAAEWKLCIKNDPNNKDCSAGLTRIGHHFARRER